MQDGNGRRLRCAVLGLGRIGRIHATNLARHVAGAVVVACADPDRARAEVVAADLGIGRLYTDYRAALDDPDVEAVAICTPSDTHFQVIMDAAGRGKQIFCEKPVDLDLARIHEVRAEVDRRGVTLMVAFQRRYDPEVLALRETVRSGAIGTPQILRITSRDPQPPPESFLRGSGGLFMDMSIHDFDMARYLMSAEVTEVYASGCVLIDEMFTRAGDWDTAAVTLTFDTGARALIDNSRQSVYGYDQRSEVFGSRGVVGIGHRAINGQVSGPEPPVSPDRPFFLDRYKEAYRREVQAFVDAVLAGRPAPVGVVDGLRAVEVALAATRSAREHRPVAITEVSAPGRPDATG
jgi:myo-inositol 2-dehydrogenase/D-chiro-inositol 1-dehydrogenase